MVAIRRDFFAQEFQFDDGSCVHRPVGCKAEYYFPPHNDSDPLGGCSAYTEKGAKRIELLRGIENGTVSIKDPVVVASMKGPIAEGEREVQSDSKIKIRAKFEAASEQAPRPEPDEGQQAERRGKHQNNEHAGISKWENECREEFPVSTDSPLAKVVNRLLWGDWDKGEFGVSVRTTDMFEDPEALAKVYRTSRT
jgi:hypothetical protein